jgi:hypothetical protein
MTAAVTVRAGYNPVRVTHTRIAPDPPEERLLAPNETVDFILSQGEDIGVKIEPAEAEVPPPEPPPPPPPPAARETRRTRERE